MLTGSNKKLSALTTSRLLYRHMEHVRRKGKRKTAPGNDAFDIRAEAESCAHRVEPRSIGGTARTVLEFIQCIHYRINACRFTRRVCEIRTPAGREQLLRINLDRGTVAFAQRLKRRGLIRVGRAQRSDVTQVLGISYRELGVGVARNWNLPERLVDGMQRLSADPYHSHTLMPLQ
jgi:hypothetical protein